MYIRYVLILCATWLQVLGVNGQQVFHQFLGMPTPAVKVETSANDPPELASAKQVIGSYLGLAHQLKQDIHYTAVNIVGVLGLFK